MTDRIKDSKTFCMMPWIHMHAFADGRVYPCCFGDYHMPMGNLRDNTMEEVWNNEEYRNLRLNMLNNKPSAACKKCYEQEGSSIFSLRNSINQSHGKYVDEVELTKEDGTHPEFKLRYWDVRFSNLCNFSCRSCGPVFSSNWYKEHVKMFGRKPDVDGKELSVVEYAGRSKYDIWEQMQPHIPYLDQVYFAGGEPLIMEEHYMLLEKLIEIGKTDINLQYNTNFSELSFKKKDVIELWKHFKNVNVGASLDGMWERGELMRKGQDWNQVIDNRKRMIEEVPHVGFHISSTVSAMNVLHVLDFHKDWVNQDLIKPEDFDVNVLYSPDWYRLDMLPEKFKREVVKPAYEKHIAWLADKDPLTRATNGFRGALNMMMSTDRSDQIPAFRKQVNLLDGARGEDFWSTFPELRVLKENDSMCILPWVSLETSPVGTARPCCLAEDEITDTSGKKMSVKEHNLSDIINSEYMQNLRKQFRNGEKPETCKKCWVEEAAGRASKRINTQVKFKDIIKDIPILKDTVDNVWFLDLKLGNICNLKCRICGSWSSSKWAGEEIDYLKANGATFEEQKQHTAYRMLKDGAWPRESDAFWESLDELLPSIRYLEFTGGEPMMIPEHFKLLKRAVDMGYASNIRIHYNTNGTIYPEKFIEVWRKFEHVEIAFSIDNVGKRFEYERYPANWNDVNSNIKKFEILKQSTNNIDLQLCFTVNILNVLYLDELLDWAKDIDFDTMHWNMLHGPYEMSIACLPADAKKKVIDVLLAKEFNSLHQQDIDNVISMIQNGESTERDLLIKKLEVTDKYRKEHLRQTHPELAEILNYGN